MGLMPAVFITVSVYSPFATPAMNPTVPWGPGWLACPTHVDCPARPTENHRPGCAIPRENLLAPSLSRWSRYLFLT